MSFKFGFTHDPVFRWANPTYGYAVCVQKYDRMDILYDASDAVGPGFLEAALVNLYKGRSGCHNENLGGDTMPKNASLSGPYFTYVVSRSFKHPPPMKGL
ncbi:unnamed protein product [Symbiodinium sp. CCMP2592]|nr:unnamed protein product [Symbiodinium sp. CCMP2592]